MHKLFGVLSAVPLILGGMTSSACAQTLPYVVDGLALGGRVHFGTKSYKEYDCSPSEKFQGFTWCHKEATERKGRGGLTVANSILHTGDGTAVYVNRYIRPARLGPTEVRTEINRLSAKFGQQAREIWLPSREGLPQAVIAVWGRIQLQPLDAAAVSTVASGGGHKGILVSFLGDLQRSAQAQVPVYEITGGALFVWAAAFTKRGRGTLRFLAMDPSRVQPPDVPPPPTPPLQSTRAPVPPEANITSSGTAFFVAPNVLLTNYHVVRGCGGRVQARYPDGPSYPASVSGLDETNDLALLRTSMAYASLAAFHLQPRLGEGIAAYGFPFPGLLSSSGNFTLGNVTSLTGMGDDTRFLQMSAPTQPGNSGGPLLDMSGSVVGIVVAQLNALTMMREENSLPQNVNFAIHATIVINFLSVKGIAPKLNSSTDARTMPPPDVADLAKQFTVQVYCYRRSAGTF